MEEKPCAIVASVPRDWTSQLEDQSDSGSDGGVSIGSSSAPQSPVDSGHEVPGTDDPKDFLITPPFDDDQGSLEDDKEDDADIANFVYDTKEDLDRLMALRLSDALDKRVVDVSAEVTTSAVEMRVPDLNETSHIEKSDKKNGKLVTTELSDVVDEKDLDPETRALLGLPELEPEGAEMDEESRALVNMLLEQDAEQEKQEERDREANQRAHEEAFDEQAGNLDLNEREQTERPNFRYLGGGYQRPKYYYELETGKQYESW